MKYNSLTPAQATTRRLLYHWAMFARCVEDAKLHESIKAKCPEIWKMLCDLHNTLNGKKAKLLTSLPADLRAIAVKELNAEEVKDLLSIFDGICDGDIEVVVDATESG